jgi:two-component system response regulator AtoC
MAGNALVMVVDDDPRIRELIRTVLGRDGHDVVEAADGAEALRRLDEALPDVLIIDRVMPVMDGMKLIEAARRRDSALPLIMLTGQADVGAAVEAMRLGAMDFIAKPFEVERLRAAVAKAIEGQTLRREVFQLRGEQCRRIGEIGSILIGAGVKMTGVYRTLKQVAKSPTTTVLIQGESGTGKELIARAIHLSSNRRNKRFVDINCAALTESLLEAELFGYEKGAFTGAASNGKPGLFEAADGGTIFLDEIGEMSLPLQAKLLRVLQERRFKRVGGIDDVNVDVRIIASTNRDLETLVQEGEFRLDLYYRLRVIPIIVPPLRERVEDVRAIAEHYVEIFASEMSRRVIGFTPDAMEALEKHPWPGNVRELRNVIERAVILSADEIIGIGSLLFGGAPTKEIAAQAAVPAARIEVEAEAEALPAVAAVEPPPGYAMMPCSIAEMEKKLIRRVLESTAWRRAEAARILGINRTTLYNKIREYAIDPGRG